MAVPALFFSHFLGVGIYGMAIGCCELWRWRMTRPDVRSLIRDATVLLLPFLLIIPLTLASPTVEFARQTEWTLWPNKAVGLYLAFKSFSHASATVLALIVVPMVFWGSGPGGCVCIPPDCSSPRWGRWCISPCRSS